MFAKNESKALFVGMKQYVITSATDDYPIVGTPAPTDHTFVLIVYNEDRKTALLANINSLNKNTANTQKKLEDALDELTSVGTNKAYIIGGLANSTLSLVHYRAIARLLKDRKIPLIGQEIFRTPAPNGSPSFPCIDARTGRMVRDADPFDFDGCVEIPLVAATIPYNDLARIEPTKVCLNDMKKQNKAIIMEKHTAEHAADLATPQQPSFLSLRKG
jgi:hypothetical protein